MTMAQIIDGRKQAKAIREGLIPRVQSLRAKGIIPHLDVVLIGEHSASMIYVATKEKAARAIGIDCIIHRLPTTISQQDALDAVSALNRTATHGILIQLPVPAHLDADALINAIKPKRDVDGLTIVNAGERVLGYPSLLPCTPKACLKLIKTVQPDLTGLHATVIGRSNLVGKPVGQLLLREDCTVTQIHSKSENAISLIRQADILVVAIGKPHHVKGEWIKPGAVVIDVGITREDGIIKGDVDFEQAKRVARAITPVPGGVGPMTVACLLENVVEAAEGRLN